MNKKNIWDFVLVLSISSTVGIFMILLFYVVIHDSVLLTLYNFISDFQSQGRIDSGWVDVAQTCVEVFEMIPGIVDTLWFIGFIALIWSLVIESYFAKRDGYWTVFTFITVGMMIFMFLSSFVLQINTWLHTVLIDGILSGVSPQLTFFNFYITNHAVINLFVIALCVVANFVDMDFAKFNSRKKKESVAMNDEIA